ncbi:hypothetical protein [Rhodopirellula sp. P2]|uniref:hypothetical protein n=1 Tax=Rhodopirellula sp. P2 TaxID=2127060 RepID=UPI0023676C7F|nr:hypothetical protein [Rhodopirellula sp. P2]WDQ17355.1 hypothetical protein PSR62_02080 [Rhodopirellula sp. P2]
MNAIRTQALDAIWRSETLISLRDEFHERLKQDKSPARFFEIVDDLFSMPAVNVADIVAARGVSKPTAMKDLERLEHLKIVEEYTGKERDREWVARDIIHVIEQEAPANE